MSKIPRDSAEFRQMAVEMVIARKKHGAMIEVAKELVIPYHQLAGWYRTYRKQQARKAKREMASEKASQMDAKDKRIAQLEEELAILKKAAAYFAKSLS